MTRITKAVAFLIILVLGIYSWSLAGPVPDTGQTQSYTDTFGEDSDYTINPPSYTKLDASGNDLPDNATSWAMVKDNVTGLIWEVKTDDGSIHDKYHEYAWQDAQNVFVAGLNAENFGGAADWRLPTIKELSSIVNSGVYRPAINTDYFPKTVSSYYWSSSTYAFNAGYAWSIYFFNGYGSSYNKSNSYYVRAVRGGQSGLLDNLVINGDGTVTDTDSGLIWQQETAGAMSWEAALAYCENLSLAGYPDWRLPNRNELQSLVDYGKYYPAIDTTAFPDTMSSDYWSSSASAYSAGYAWGINFYFGGYDYYSNKSNSYYVRAVRGGQSGSFDNLVISLSASPADLDVSFTAAVSGGTPPYIYSWEFGDGGTSSQHNPSHTYTTTGTYTATVTVTDASGQSATNSTAITVTESTEPLAVNPGAISSLGVGETGTITISGGTSPYSATSSDDLIATTYISDNIVTVTGVADGTATITVKDSDSNSVTVDVTVGESCDASTLSADLSMHLPYLKYQTLLGDFWLWADFQYMPVVGEDILFKVTDFEVIEPPQTACEAATLSGDLSMHVPQLNYQTLFGNFLLWVDFEYVPSTNDDILFMLTDFGNVD